MRHALATKPKPSMSSKQILAAVSALLLATADAGASHVIAKALTRRDDPAPSLSPELHPSSDKEFFAKDYPSDVHPKVDQELHKFEPPYPLIQDESQFDKDFVKDENSDGGEWKAQMQYDELRHKLREEQNDVKKAMENVDKVQTDLTEAEAKQKVAEEDAKKAEGEAKGARDKLDDAHGEVDKIKAKAGPGDNHEVVDATKKVEDKVDNLEDCKKELEDAKAKLEKLLEEQRAEDKKMEHKLTEDIEQAEADVKEAQAKKEAAEAVQAEKEKTEATAEENVRNAQGEFDSATQDLEKEQAEAEKAEKDLAKATERLRKNRYNKGGEGGGGIAPDDGSSKGESPDSKRSGAAPSAFPMRASLLTLALSIGISFTA